LEYIKKFDQFLARCGEDESDAIVLSRFRANLKDELRRELIVRDLYSRASYSSCPGVRSIPDFLIP